MRRLAPETALGRLLDAARARGAGDLHGQAGKPWHVRVHGVPGRLPAEAFPAPSPAALTGRIVGLRAPALLELHEAGGARHHLRLAGLEPPPDPADARALRQTLATLVVSQEVQAVTTVPATSRDGAALVELGGTNLNAWLLTAGLARTAPGALQAVPMRNQLDLLAAEARAREARRGTWKQAP